ncbi:unnamed protein product [Heligmosomoides polygyrus]|uniref:CCHC-type domain-containing protein n=1 Tax=Heligmosomoides polygyrus TaxID=6339 RepID=A0A183GKK0_HELPZ|nr:unnamed protein product [Heligmosomoides polygyrus]
MMSQGLPYHFMRGGDVYDGINGSIASCEATLIVGKLDDFTISSIEDSLKDPHGVRKQRIGRILIGSNKMGRSDDDAHMVVSDDEESSPRQVRSVSTGFPYETLVRELREVVTMLYQVPETVTEELSEHKVSARYKEKHGEILRRELTKAREAVERLIKGYGFTQVLSSRIVEELDKRGAETIDDWDQYLRTMEKDGEMLAQIAGILNVDVLQIVKAVKEVKATADAGAEPKASQKSATEGGRSATQTGPKQTGRGNAVNQQRNSTAKRCYNCSRFGHVSRECPEKNFRVEKITENKVLDEHVSQLIESARSMGVRAPEDRAQELSPGSPLVGKKVSTMVGFLGTKVPALLDTGSMVSIVPIGVLAKAKMRGVDVDALEIIRSEWRRPVYDASNNRMEFLGAVRIEVEMENCGKKEVAFYITDSAEEEILIGTNALEDLGVSLQMTKPQLRHEDDMAEQFRKVTVAKRIYIPPHGSGVVAAHCENGTEMQQCVIWPTKEGLDAGVCEVRDRHVRIPVVNRSGDAVVLGEGEEIGHWDTEKWKESVDGFNALMISDALETGCRWPKKILSDKGGEFENKVMAELTKITGIDHVTTKGYNPRENGLTERLNGTIVSMLRRSTVIPTEWDVRLPFCMLAYNMTPHGATGESPYFVLHGMDPYFPSSVIPNGGISWYTMDKNIDDYKAQMLQSVAEVHDRVREYNEEVRERMKREYDHRNRVDAKKYPKVGDRVYLLAPNEKAAHSHPKLVCEWSGPFRVLETSENSALISRIGSDVEPLGVQFDVLRVIPSCISDESIDTRTKRGKMSKKNGRRRACSITASCFSGATLLSPLEKGHLMFICEYGCFNGVTLKDIERCNFPGAVGKEPVSSLWAAWIATSIFQRTDIGLGEKIRLHREGAICLDGGALKDVLKMANNKCIDWTDWLFKVATSRSPIMKHYEQSVKN